ncbi:MAG TPA: type II secretion system protein GspG [Thioploca sp.]|nr:MAG: type II secretion system protein GspG [Gammaproteobacteria bacterium]HDN26158.1 type II secretion system protein GspG [Thioploca sp.]
MKIKSLISNRNAHQQTGFTLSQLLIVLAILGLLVMLVGPRCMCRDQQIQRKTTLVKIADIETALDLYRLDIHEYPKTLDALIKNETNSPRWQGPYLKKGIPNDPWGNPFQYQIPGRHGNDYDLFSYGADGQLGGEGEDADVVNWQVK